MHFDMWRIFAILLLCWGIAGDIAAPCGKQKHFMPLAYGTTGITIPTFVKFKKITIFEYERYEFYRAWNSTVVVKIVFSQHGPFVVRPWQRGWSITCMNGMRAWQKKSTFYTKIMVRLPKGGDEYALLEYPMKAGAWASGLARSFRPTRPTKRTCGLDPVLRR